MSSSGRRRIGFFKVIEGKPYLKGAHSRIYDIVNII